VQQDFQNFVQTVSQGKSQLVKTVSQNPITLKMVYFFAGRKRKGDLKECMLKVFEPLNITLLVEEIDLLLGGDEHDLSDTDRQSDFLSKLASYTFVVITPPCLTHSRAPWTNSYGPHPIRSALYPAGFPWLSNKDKLKAELRNNLISFTWSVLNEVQKLSETPMSAERNAVRTKRMHGARVF
jgi:hypothetical protein